MRAGSLLLVAWCACAHPMAAPSSPDDLPRDQTRYYTIWLGGARVGTATEIEMWNERGMTLTRTEDLRFLRGHAPLTLRTTIEIVASTALVPERVTWREESGDALGASASGSVRSVTATNGDHGWIRGGERIALTRDAVPAELVPLIVRRDGRFRGPIFLPARGFVSGAGRVDPVAPSRLVARLALSAGTIAEATIDLAPDGSPARVVDGEGVIAMRAGAVEAGVPFAPVDLVAATAVSIDGVPTNGARLSLVGDLALPALPGQTARPGSTGLIVELSANLPGALQAGPRGPDRGGEIESLVERVRARIAPDLGARTSSARDVDAATAGDCTTFALAYAALASRAGIPTRVVTGLRVDGERLARHRWAVSWTGRAWIAVDAAFGRVPAGGDLVGLAVHDADDAGLIAGEAALTQVRAAHWL